MLALTPDDNNGGEIAPTEEMQDLLTHWYTIKEVNEAKDGITYDPTVYTVCVKLQDKEGNAVDMRQEYDDDDANFDNSDIGDNVLLESELQDDYSVKDADEGFDDDLGDEEPDEASLAQIEADNGDDLFDGE